MNLKEYQELCKKTAKKFDDDKEILTWNLEILSGVFLYVTVYRNIYILI